MKWGRSREVAGGVAVALAILLAVLLALTDDPRDTVAALWRAFRFPWGFALGGLAMATVLDR